MSPSKRLSLGCFVALIAAVPLIAGGSQKAAKRTKGDVITNSIGMKLVYIPPGKFLMGSPRSELERSGDELQHEVEITQGFFMGAFHVTQEQYQKIMGTNPSYFSSTGNARDRVAGLDTQRFPVENSSWKEAKKFCSQLSAKEGKTYRLPTEAQWEYACRAGTTTPFYFGATISTDQANYSGDFVYGNGQKGVFRGRTTEVGSFPPNAFGLYDMHGNVWQWCEDWYDAKYYENSPQADPLNATPGKDRVLRGGASDSLPKSCRSARRLSDAPDAFSSDFGFRIVLLSP
jgi:formylglycine-generating enzyme required for sulfatase activity